MMEHAGSNTLLSIRLLGLTNNTSETILNSNPFSVVSQQYNEMTAIKPVIVLVPGAWHIGATTSF